MTWIDIGSVDDVPLRGARLIRTRIGCIAVFRTGETEVFATSDACPHKGGPLNEGIVHGKRVTCPLHNWVFDLETGQAEGEENGRIETYPIRIVDNRMLINLVSVGAQSAA